MGTSDVLAVLFSYVLGGIPFSYLVARWRTGINILERGEGNVGARNVFHVVGPGWGALAALLDAGKGAAAYFVARQLASVQTTILVCGFAAPLGHNFSPFLRFRGGKGLGATFGFLLGFLPLSTAAGSGLIGLVYWVTRDVNKALVLGIPAVILLPMVFGAPWWTLPYVLCLFLVLAVKKVLDRPHEQAVWARDPWDEGQPGFHEGPREEAHGKTRSPA